MLSYGKKILLNTNNLIFSIVILLMILLFIIHFLAPSLIVNIKSPIVNLIKTPVKYANTNENKIYLNSKDGLSLVGIHGKSITKKKGSVILLHGIRGSKEHFKAISDFLNKNGYDTFAFDLRGHGESGGIYCTFGDKEKHDVSTIVDYIINTKNDKNVNIWGQSLGGAIAIQALAMDKRIKSGIIESTFSDFRTIVHDYAKDFIGIEIPILTDYLIERAGNIAKFNPDGISPNRDCMRINQPMLFVHGNNDEKINIKYGVTNFNNLRTNKKQFLEIENAGHFDVWEKGGDEYSEKVLRFLDKNNN